MNTNYRGQPGSETPRPEEMPQRVTLHIPSAEPIVFAKNGVELLSTGHGSVDLGTNPKDLLGMKKPPLRLLPAAALIYMSRVMGLGAKKYGPYNWRGKKIKLTVYLEAAMRHVLQKLDGEDLDPESNQPHEAHAMACMAILLDALATGNLVDDRPTPGAASRLLAELTETT